MSTAGSGHPIVGLSMLPNPEYLVSCTSAGHVRAWHLASNDTVAQLSIEQELTSILTRQASHLSSALQQGLLARLLRLQKKQAWPSFYGCSCPWAQSSPQQQTIAFVVSQTSFKLHVPHLCIQAHVTLNICCEMSGVLQCLLVKKD